MTIADPSEEIRILREMLLDMVHQNCNVSGRPGYDVQSSFISCQAEAIRYLCQHKMMTMVENFEGRGRCVYAKSISHEEIEFPDPWDKYVDKSDLP